MFGGNGVSLADIAAVTGNRNGDGFGSGEGWWVLIILFALFGGWGYGGYGFGGGGGSSMQGALTRGDLCMDMNFQNLSEATRGISDTVNVGFANLNNAFCQQSYETMSLINGLGTAALQTANAQNITALQNQNALQAMITQCCCDLKSLFAQAEYNRATDTCSIKQAIQDATRDIIANDNANYRQLHDEQIALQMQQKDAQITALTAALTKCDNQNLVSQAVRSVVDQVRPTAGPAWIVPNPNAVYGNGFGFGFNNSCGCQGANAFNFG